MSYLANRLDPARRAALLARRDKQALPFPAHSAADTRAARNALYLDSKNVLPGHLPSLSVVEGQAVVSKVPFNLSPRYATVVTNANIRRQRRLDDRRLFVAAMQA